jgi:hypothetical protein
MKKPRRRPNAPKRTFVTKLARVGVVTALLIAVTMTPTDAPASILKVRTKRASPGVSNKTETLYRGAGAWFQRIALSPFTSDLRVEVTGSPCEEERSL